MAPASPEASAYAAPQADLAAEEVDARALERAPRWRRALACTLDWGIFWGLLLVAFAVYSPEGAADLATKAKQDAFGYLAVGFLALNFLTLGLGGRSVGLFLTRLQLVDRTGRPAGFLRAALPRWGLFLGLFLVDVFTHLVDGPGFYCAALVVNAACCFFGEKRSLLDRVTQTDAVVKR